MKMNETLRETNEKLDREAETNRTFVRLIQRPRIRTRDVVRQCWQCKHQRKSRSSVFSALCSYVDTLLGRKRKPGSKWSSFIADRIHVPTVNKPDIKVDKVADDIVAGKVKENSENLKQEEVILKDNDFVVKVELGRDETGSGGAQLDRVSETGDETSLKKEESQGIVTDLNLKQNVENKLDIPPEEVKPEDSESTEDGIGLGTPREPIRLVVEEDSVRCIGTKTKSLDVTEQLIDSANKQQEWQQEIFGYILKKDSPSCGMERVKQYRNGSVERTGIGIYANQMMRNFPNLPVEEEGRLGDPVIRENFIQRVFIYYRWGQLLASGLNFESLTKFHAQHKLILMSHEQNLARELGRELSESSSKKLQEYADEYISKLMALLKIKASRGNHVNVLQHIQGYLKKHLDREDKRELTEAIEQYRLGYLPLIVPITLLRHHFLKYPGVFCSF